MEIESIVVGFFVQEAESQGKDYSHENLEHSYVEVQLRGKNN